MLTCGLRMSAAGAQTFRAKRPAGLRSAQIFYNPNINYPDRRADIFRKWPGCRGFVGMFDLPVGQTVLICNICEVRVSSDYTGMSGRQGILGEYFTQNGPGSSKSCSQVVYPLSCSNDLNSFRHDSVLGRVREPTNIRHSDPNSNVMSKDGKTFQRNFLSF